MSLINKELMELIEDVKQGYGCEGFEKRRFTEEYKQNDSDYKKIEEINHPIDPGAKVEIYWKQFDDPDYGYIFTLPGDDEEDIFIDGIIHIPFPQGGEKCQDEPEWIYLGRLLSYPDVIKVKITGR